MYIVIWKFEIKPEFEHEFIQAYGPNGLWVQLFQKNKHENAEEIYLGTELFKKEKGNGYLTIDRWLSPEAYKKFLKDWRTEYKTLDEYCDAFVTRQSKVGTFSLK